MNRIDRRPSSSRETTPAERNGPAGSIEPMVGIEGWAAALSCDRRTIERMRAAGRLPRPDLVVGNRMPRWKAATLRAWIEGGGKA